MRSWLISAFLGAPLPAAVLSHTWRESKLDLTLDDGAARIEWISPNSFRVTRAWSSAPTSVSKIDHDPVLVAMEESPRAFVMRTRYITVEIPKAAFGVQVRSGDTSVASASIEHDRQLTSVTFSPIDHAYGLKGGSLPTLDLHGHTVENANGLFYTSNNYAISLPSPQTAAFDFDRNEMRVRNSNSIEFVFYHAASPKELFEQHAIAAGLTEIRDQALQIGAKDQLPKEATPLLAPMDSWEALQGLVRTLNQWSLSAVLYPAFDLQSLENAPESVRSRGLELAAVLPLIFSSKPGVAAPDARVRDSLRPYLRTYLREAHDRGFPLIHPYAMQFPKDAGSDQQMDSFLLGDELLVAPVLGPGNRRTLKLPRGLWTDLRTNTEYRGNQTIEFDAPLGRVPMFARNGSVVPLSVTGKMEVHYFPSLGGEFFLWEQDEEDNSQFHAAPAGEFLRVEIESKLNRTYEWVLHHTKAPKAVEEESGIYQRASSARELRPGMWWHDDERDDLHILLHADVGTDRIINVSF